MGRKKKEKIPSNNFCIICGRYTNDKKFPKEEGINYFFVCNNCKKVWCGPCMGQVTGLGAPKTLRMGRKGKIACPDCNQFAAMLKLPTNLPFIQKKGAVSTTEDSQELVHTKFCKFCGEDLPENATFCHVCGGKQ